MYVSQEDRTALIWAAMNGHTEVVKALIEKGADLDAKEKVRCRCCVSTEEGANNERILWDSESRHYRA
jgi:ankyrin repeat protein